MNNTPLVTIVTICYNVYDELEKTIQSVSNQTYKHIEYIIVDGGSNDGSVELIKQNQGHISQWISEPDKGIYDAMNKGIDMANGEWIIFMNAGDVFYRNNVVELLARKTYSKEIGIVYGDVELDFGKAGRCIRSLQSFKNKNVTTQLCHQGLMTRTELLKQIHFDTSYRIMADLNSFKIIQEMGYMLQYEHIIFAMFEATGGISTTKPFLSLNESCRLNNINVHSITYYKRFIHAAIKLFLYKILPTDLYNTIRYKIIYSHKQYK